MVEYDVAMEVAYDVACAHCAACSASSITTEADCIAAAGADPLADPPFIPCTWSAGTCGATIARVDATSLTFAKAILGAFIYSAASCCPGQTATSPIQCGGQCGENAYGSAAIIDTSATLKEALPEPEVVALDANWMNALVCAEDTAWAGSPDDYSTATPLDGTGCLFEMVMDGICQWCAPHRLCHSFPLSDLRVACQRLPRRLRGSAVRDQRPV